MNYVHDSAVICHGSLFWCLHYSFSYCYFLVVHLQHDHLVTTFKLSHILNNTLNNVFLLLICSAVTIIVVTIFIATFQNYRIVFLSRYFLCVRKDIFARYLRYANMIDSPPVYSSFSFNHASITCRRDAWLPPGDRGWAASPSVKDAATAFEVTCRWWSPWPEPSLWRHSSQLPAYVYVVAFKLVYRT